MDEFKSTEPVSMSCLEIWQLVGHQIGLSNINVAYFAYHPFSLVLILSPLFWRPYTYSSGNNVTESHSFVGTLDYCMIGLCLLMAGDDSRMVGGESRMAGGESRMAGGESRMTGDCCRADGIQPDLYIDAYARIHTCMPYIYGLVALLDNIQSSFSSITISTSMLLVKIVNCMDQETSKILCM
jgi:hypothetical protein